MEDIPDNGTAPISFPQATSTQSEPPHVRVQRFVDNVFAAIVDELLLPDGKPTITLKRRSKKTAHFFINPTNGALETAETETCATWSWPGKDVHEAWRFTVAIRILGIIAEAVQAGLVISKRSVFWYKCFVCVFVTKGIAIAIISLGFQTETSKLKIPGSRDIYYNDPACFGSQRVVDMVIDDIAHTIGVDRAVLNVEAAAKGLTAGCFQIRTRSNNVISPWISTEDTLIPRAEDIDEIDISGIKWVLILEKEAVFRRLASGSFHVTAAAGRGILITGKGYPDLCTRAFVRRLADIQPRSQAAPQIYALVDSDPDGVAIMSTYKYGSMAQAQENARLNAPRIQWLGLRTSDVVAGADTGGDDALIRLSARDRRKVIAMLKNSPVWAEDGPEPEWRAELQQMLMLNLKAEIEVLYDREGGLEEWIDRQMRISKRHGPAIP